jgi:hypothetical protein
MLCSPFPVFFRGIQVWVHNRTCNASNHHLQTGQGVDPVAEEEARELYERGMARFEANNLQEAYFLFQDALKLVPLTVSALKFSQCG